MKQKPSNEKSKQTEEVRLMQSDRRKALKTLGVGGAVAGVANMPAQWAKPVVDSIILPTHAATTDDSGALGSGAPTPAPTTTGDPCSVSCGIGINMDWGHNTNASAYRDVFLEVLTPGGTRISPNHAQRGRCLQLDHHDGAAISGTGQISDINGSIAPGRYALFVNIGAGVGTGSAVSVYLSASACNDTDDDSERYYETANDTGVYSVGSINVSQGGTATVRVEL